MKRGEQVEFKPARGKVRKGTLRKISLNRGKAIILLDGDPFPVKVNISQLTSCAETTKNVPSSAKVRKARTTTEGETQPMPSTKPSAKELRKQAQALDIEDWEDMGLKELRQAVAEAEGESKPKAKRRTSSKSKTRKSASKKAPATRKRAPAKKTAAKKTAASKKMAAPKKAAASKSTKKDSSEPSYTDPTGTKAKGVDNPFRSGSNLHKIFPILVPRGGKRRTLAERLQKKVDIHPYINDEGDIDLLDYDKRIVLAAQTLRDKHGYAIERQGRGLDGTIKCFPPGSEHDPRTSNGASKSRKKARSKS